MSAQPGTGVAVSVLYPGDRSEAPGARVEAKQPAHLPDLHLDQVVKVALAGRDEYDLAPFFYAPLEDEAAVRYRQEVCRDLERREVADVVSAFAKLMRQARTHLRRMAQVEGDAFKQGCFLDAAASYSVAVTSLHEGLERLAPSSQALGRLREHLAAYRESERFGSLASEVNALRDGLSRVQYSVLVRGNRVTVARYEAEQDLSALVEEAFAKWRSEKVEEPRADLPDQRDTNHVYAQVLERVAHLYPQLFSRLQAFYARRHSLMDPTVVAFDREVQFYLAYLNLVYRLRGTGTAFCYPEVSSRSKQLSVAGGSDIALALALSRYGTASVTNDMDLSGPERIVVVTGPNQGGKTTFARMFGQLHYLAGLGVPVPAAAARLYLPDRVFTHFEKEERLDNLQGKLNDELERVRYILFHATSRSVIVMNESFGSTSLADSRFIGAKVLEQVSHLGALCVYVTFVDELASLDDATVSAVAEVSPDDPDVRTYKVSRRPADGRAYAMALARKYGLTYRQLRERVGR
jgi:DNA mismatch repair protein MutS